jgi:CubicO group peptidase (beta-lactamase class C family)
MSEAPTAARVSQEELASRLAELQSELQVPGVAAGIYHEGEEQYAVQGVTSLESPVPVDENTLFQFGSTGKTFTATAIMRLVEAGELELDDPVRRYVPELALKDEDTAARVTVLQLLNHSAGWQGDFFEDTGRGDDAIARYVEKMADLEQVSSLGSQASYNNAALVLAGRVLEKVTGKVYEDAIEELLLQPLGLKQTFALMNDIMTRRFAVGHTHRQDGRITVARPWALPRSVVPAGGWVASIRDQIAWARFHLGDGRGVDGEQILSKAALDRMKLPTFSLGGGAIGDSVGISWLIKDIDGVRLVGHGGSTNGQRAAFQMVPARDFAVVVLTNSVPNGAQLHGTLVTWALERYLGVVEAEPEPVTLTEEELAEYGGEYATITAFVHLTVEDGQLQVKIEPTPEALARTRELSGEEPEDQPPFPIAILANDRYVISGGSAKGQRGYFVRDDVGAVTGINLGGRLAAKRREEP